MLSGLTKKVVVLICVLSSLVVAQFAQAAEKKPSVLFVTMGPRAISFSVLRKLNKEGLQVNYTGRRPGSRPILKWKDIKDYNCLVILKTGINLGEDQTVKTITPLLKKFMAKGGGVFLAPGLMHWDHKKTFAYWAKYFGEPYGAWFMRKQIVRESDPQKARAAGFFNTRYHYSENVVKHPVTEGVTAFWYPVHSKTETKDLCNRTMFSWPLAVDKNWTVLLRASDTSKTEVVNHTFTDLDIQPMESTQTTATPAMMAVRSFDKGRMALMAINAQFHFVAGNHRNKAGSMKTDTGGYNMEKGFDTRPSHFYKLLANTLKWLCQPSLAGDELGGYVQKASDINEPLAPPTRAVNWTKRTFKPNMPLFRGLIGARTELSGGKGSVADYKKAALEAGLDFVVFMDMFEHMTEEKFKRLKKQCADLSDEKINLVPGLHIKDNRGHDMFQFGTNERFEWISDPKFLTEDGKRLNQATRKQGDLPHVWFTINRFVHYNAQGYFNFPASPIARMWNVKLYHAVGLFHYNAGELVDGMAENFSEFLEVNNSGCNIQPYSIDRVQSPKELKRAVAAGHMLTCVRAKDLKKITRQWGTLIYNYLQSPNVFVSNGPLIRDWTCINRDCVINAQSFVTPNYRYEVRLHVTSDVGLAEIKIWDGLELYMVIRPEGVKDYQKIFHFSHNQQKNLILEVTDTQGRKAVSAEQFDRNHMNMHYWCGDRINGMLKHGPLYFFYTRGEDGMEFTSKGQDSYRLFARPGQISKNALLFKSSAGTFQKGLLANRPLQDLVSEDVGVYTNKSSMQFPAEEKPGNVWRSLGPLFESKLYDLNETHIQWRNHYPRANPYNPSVRGIPNQGDIVPGLNISEYVFKKKQTIEQLPVDSVTYGQYKNIPGNEMIVALCPDAKSKPRVFCLERTSKDFAEKVQSMLNPPAKPFVIKPGGWYAVYGSKSGAATKVAYNVGDVGLVVRTKFKGLVFYADVEGKTVDVGDRIVIKRLGLAGKVPDLTGAWRYARIHDYLGLDGRPGYKMNLIRGKSLPVTDGFCDLVSQKGAVEFKMKKPEVGLQMTLPVRVTKMNDKWSAVCWDKVLNRARPIGVYQGVGYARFDPEYHDLTHAVVGHPVVADNPEAVIICTVLGDEKYPYSKEKTWAYTLQVNNPTDKPMKLKLTNAMKLPEFPFEKKQLILKPGECVDVIADERF